MRCSKLKPSRLYFEESEHKQRFKYFSRGTSIEMIIKDFILTTCGIEIPTYWNVFTGKHVQTKSKEDNLAAGLGDL